jgi:hypothetical protein
MPRPKKIKEVDSGVVLDSGATVIKLEDNPTPPTSEFVTKEEFASAIREIKDSIKEALDRPIVTTPEPITIQVPATSVIGQDGTAISSNTIEPTGNKVPLPFEYQLFLKQILNQNFNAEIELSSDPTQFNFAVIVPKEYSNMGAEYGNTVDRRSKMISRLVAQAGVKEWLNKIYDNLPMETRTRITNERLM